LQDANPKYGFLLIGFESSFTSVSKEKKVTNSMEENSTQIEYSFTESHKADLVK
jgi:hypothetical protein